MLRIMQLMTTLKYVSSPTAAKFHTHPAYVRLLMGPVGCGKSVACCLELFRLMAEVPKGQDGYRRSRTVVIRETYPELKSTTIMTWKSLFPTPETGRMVYSSPIIHYFEYGDIRAEIVFLSMENELDIKKLMSFECNFVWINEARYSLREILRIAVQRTGRSADAKSLKLDENNEKASYKTRNCVLLDTNPCDDDHWIYKLFEEEKPNNHAVFYYPPALIKNADNEWIPNKKAENINNLDEGFDYYLKQLGGATEEWINVYICGKYGSSYDGRPVYPEYNETIHLVNNLVPVKGIPLSLGWDFGLTPACVICQFLPTGQLLVLDELTTEYMGLTNFIKDIVTPFLSHNYASFKVDISLGDPAGVQASQLNEGQTCFTILKDNGFPSQPGRTNDFLPRKESVSRRLSSLSDGKASLVISDRCKTLRKGFKGGYHYQRINVAVGRDETKYKDQANKNQYSHAHDALQYVCMHYDNFKSNSSNSTKEKAKLIKKLGLNTPLRCA